LPAVALANAMSAMKGKVPAPAFQRAAETLLAYVRNLVAHPEEPKFRRIKVRGQVLYSWEVPGSCAGHRTWTLQAMFVLLGDCIQGCSSQQQP